MRLNKVVPAGLKSALTLHVGSSQYPLADASLSLSDTQLEWADSTYSGWSVGDTVSLSLVAPPPPPPTVSLSVGPYDSVTEGSDFYVRATLSEPLPNTVRIPLTLTNHTAEPGDYEYRHDKDKDYIAIVAGQTPNQRWFQTNHDDDADDETFTVALGTLPSPVTAGSPSSVSIRINDDDGSGELNLRLSVSPNPVPEGSPVTVRVTLYRGSSEAVVSWNVPVPLWVRRVTSEEGDHGTLESITIPWGSSSATAQIWTSRDSDADDEEFTVDMTVPRGGQARVGSPSGARVVISENRGGTGSGGGGGGGGPSSGGGGGPGPGGGGGGPIPPVLSEDASLNALGIEGASPVFDPDTDDYTLDAYDTTSLTLTPTASHDDAEITVTVNGRNRRKRRNILPRYP